MATADLRLTFGAMFVGCLISVAFSGIGTLQAYLYFRQSRRRDTQSMKLTVKLITRTLCRRILDLIHSVFICQSVWHYLVLSWGDLDELDHLTWLASIAVTGLITFVVQTFFANRVWRLSKHNAIITALIVVVAVVRLGSALSMFIWPPRIRLKHFSLFIQKFRWLFTFGLALSCIIDALITSSLCYYLQGSRTGYSSIDDIIHRLLLYTINNGLLTSFASMLAMIFAAAMPHNFLFLSLHFFIAKCYINSLLASLNSRDALKDRDDSHPMAVHISMDSPTSQPRFFRHQVVRPVTIYILVHDFSDFFYLSQTGAWSFYVSFEGQFSRKQEESLSLHFLA
ncbi:hypothetical protein DFH11DRAFT_1507892 [Phellopilus nigrolimitatus]|nr:hypothetical protein DFH11DRAFT_1507892 [Phellopilus nigrolimitatus]